MGETTEIAWCDSTFNPWQGCRKVGPGCDNCYAESLDRRWHGGVHWGDGAPRKVQSAAYWHQPINWNRKAETLGRPWRVFCASQADVFDNEAPEGQRERLWPLIKATPHLTWLLLTKRISNAPKMLPKDWGEGYHNVWLLATMVTQQEIVRDWPRLRDVPARVRGISYEPGLEPVAVPIDCDWFIIGGESGPRARPFHIEWARSAIRQCRTGHAAPFMKQLGANVVGPHANGVNVTTWRLRDRKGGDMAEWPEDLRVREFPAGF